MKIKKILALFVIIIIFTACNKKKDSNINIIKPLKLKSSRVSQKQIEKLSKIFFYGDKLNKEKEVYQKKIQKLSLKLIEIKNPFTIKEERKYEYTKMIYLFNSIWTSIYPTEKMLETRKLFTVIINYKANLDDKARKTYNKKFMGYNAKYLKDKWVWILLKNDIEIKVTANKKSVQNDEKIKELLKDFDTESMETIFDKNTKYPELKEYFLKIKKLNTKIVDIAKKFKEKETDAINTVKPFIIRDKGILKNLDLSQIHFIDNTFSISVRKNKKIVFSIYIGEASTLGLLTYFKDKTLKHSKIGNFPTTIIKNNMVIVRLPHLAVKISTYLDNEFKDTSKLLEIASSIDLLALSKVK